MYVLFATASVIMVIVVLKWNAERRKAEAEHARLRTLESSGILAEGIAHDFNNLLAVISAHIQMAREAGKQDGERNEILATAINACMRAKELSRQLLTFATGGEPVRIPMKIQGLIAGSVKQAVGTSAVSAELDLPQGLHRVAVDEDQIRQVFTSLVNNAVEAMRQGGSLAVRGENIDIQPRSGSELPDGAYVRVTIRDTGIGIAAENLPKIFDPYYSTKDTFSKKGLGLSLAVCHSIIRRHGGLLAISSEVGTGTTVTVLLPAADHDVAAARS
jgi:signal transduction histidine kinase